MDGITYLCPRKDVNKVNKVKEEMTNLTGLYIEDNIYTKFVVRDVKIICVVTRWIAGNLSKIFNFIWQSAAKLKQYNCFWTFRDYRKAYFYELSRVH